MTNGRTTTNPTAITHARVGTARSSRLARDEQSIATVQHRAAPNPPRMAVIAEAVLLRAEAARVRRRP